jgi:hypothetical protein
VSAPFVATPTYTPPADLGERIQKTYAAAIAFADGDAVALITALGTALAAAIDQLGFAAPRPGRPERSVLESMARIVAYGEHEYEKHRAMMAPAVIAGLDALIELHAARRRIVAQEGGRT